MWRKFENFLRNPFVIVRIFSEIIRNFMILVSSLECYVRGNDISNPRKFDYGNS